MLTFIDPRPDRAFRSELGLATDCHVQIDATAVSSAEQSKCRNEP
jgi:hypothetical protein